MATMPASKPSNHTEYDEDSLARFHRAVRDESESFLDMWSLPLETLGVLAPLRVLGVQKLTGANRRPYSVLPCTDKKCHTP